MRRRLVLLMTVVALAAPYTAGASEDGEKKKAGGESYLQIQTLLGMTVRGRGGRGLLAVDCGLDIPNPVLRKRAEQYLPRLRDAYIQTIQSYAAGLPSGVLPNAEYIGAALQRQTNVILGKPGAKLLLGAIIVN